MLWIIPGSYVLEYRQMYFEEEQEGKERAEYYSFLINFFQKHCSLNLIVDSKFVNTSNIDSSTGHSQIRPHYRCNLPWMHF